MLTTWVVDDEPLARRRLAALMSDVSWVRQLGESEDGAAAVAAIERHEPDVVFLDIRMPEMSGLEVIERLRGLPRAPTVVFTTAYDHYAVAAFELEALDYLLKPFTEWRFMAALERARASRLRAAGPSLESASRALARPPGAPVDRLLVRAGNAIVPLPIREVHRIEAQDDYIAVHAAQRSYLLSLRLAEIESRLPNPPFIRVHRSHIVNLDHVERIVGLDGSRFEVCMRGGATVPVSRARSQEIRRLSR